MTIKEKIVDVSYAQKPINWKKVKRDGISGVIIRIGFRAYLSGALVEDAMFRAHYRGAKAAGLKVGVYFFTEAIDEVEGRQEAKWVIDKIKALNLKLDYPVVIDTELVGDPRARANKLSREKRTTAVRGFCSLIKTCGYVPMVYASTYWLNSKLNMARLPYKVWVAQYWDECTYKGDYSIWQFTSSGLVKGIAGKVDLDYVYEDLQAKIKKPAKKKPKKPATVKHNDDVTPEIPRLPKRGYFKKGDRSRQVEILQRYLKATGYYVGQVDGVYGPLTEMAVIAFEKKHKLEVDGKWGPICQKTAFD